MTFLPLDVIVEASDAELDAGQVSYCRIENMRIWIQLHDAWQRAGRWHFANDRPPRAHNVALLGFTCDEEDESSATASSSGWLPVAVDITTARMRTESSDTLLELDGRSHRIARDKLSGTYWDFASGNGHTVAEIHKILQRLV